MKNTNFKKQIKQVEDNKHKRRDHWKKMFVVRGLVKSEQNEQGLEGNTHKNVCSKKLNSKQEHLPTIKLFIASQKKESWVSDHACVLKIDVVNSCIPLYHATFEVTKRFLQNRKHSKIRLNKRNIYVLQMFFIISFISIFQLENIRCCPTYCPD